MTELFFFLMIRRPPRSTLFPTRRSSDLDPVLERRELLPEPLPRGRLAVVAMGVDDPLRVRPIVRRHRHAMRSEEHTSELQSRQYLVCRLLLEKKKTSPFLSSSFLCLSPL